MSGKKIFLFFLFLIPIFFYKDLFEYFLFPKKVLFISLTSLYFIFFIIKNKKIKIYNFKYFLIFIIYITVTGFFYSKLNINTLYSNITFITFILLCTIDLKKQHYFILKILNIATFIICIYSILQLLDLDPFFYNIKDPYFLGINRIISTLGNKNYVSHFLIVTFLINQAYNLKNRFFNIFILICIFLLGSKGGILFILLFFVFFYLKKNNLSLKIFKSKWQIFLLGVLVLFLVTLSFYYIDLIFESKNSISQRLMIWKTSLDVFVKYPILGVGAGNFVEAYYYYQNLNLPYFEYNYYSESRFAHNEILHLLVEYGILGFIILFLFLYPVLKYGLKSKRYKYIFYYLLFSSFYSFPIRLPSIWIILFPIINTIVQRKKIYSSISLDLLKKIILIYFFFTALFLNVNDILVNNITKRGVKNLSERKIVKSSSINLISYIPDYNAGVFFYNKGDYEKAIYYLKRCERFTRRPLLYFYMGLSYKGQNKVDEAIFFMRKFVEFYPFSYKAYYNLYIMYKEKKEFEKANHFYSLYQKMYNEISEEHR